MIEPAGRNPYWPRSLRGQAAFIAALAGIAAVAGLGAATAYHVWQDIQAGPPSNCCPLGSAIAIGAAHDSNGTTPTAWFNATFYVQAESTGISANDLKFQLVGPSGSHLDYSSVALIDVSGCAVGYFAANAWHTSVPTDPALNYIAMCAASTGLSPASQISVGDQLVLTNGASLAGAGDSLTIDLSGPGSGSISAVIP